MIRIKQFLFFSFYSFCQVSQLAAGVNLPVPFLCDSVFQYTFIYRILCYKECDKDQSFNRFCTSFLSSGCAYPMAEDFNFHLDSLWSHFNWPVVQTHWKLSICKNSFLLCRYVTSMTTQCQTQWVCVYLRQSKIQHVTSFGFQQMAFHFSKFLTRLY